MNAEITYDLPAIIDQIVLGIILVIVAYGIFIKR